MTRVRSNHRLNLLDRLPATARRGALFGQSLENEQEPETLSDMSRGVLQELFRAAVDAAMPGRTMPASLPVSLSGQTAVIAVGKAAGEMMRVASDRIDGPFRGLVVTPNAHLPPDFAGNFRIEVLEAGHPVPDVSSIRAAKRALRLARSLRSGDQLTVLLSGGGSSMLAAPVQGITLADKQHTTASLLACGATIAELNCVRKHLSRIKAGRLAVAARGALVTTFVVSDVPGDDVSMVSSGPTVADGSTLEEARAIVRRYRLDLPRSVVRALADPRNESPGADAFGLAGTEAVVIASARDALSAASRIGERRGYAVETLGDRLQAEARQLGTYHGAYALRARASGRRAAIISGGETTVNVRNPEGRGGRNLEYALALAIALDGADGISAIACDTDGIDGKSPAAGAMVFPDSLKRAHRLSLDPAKYLERNDAHSFFEQLGDLVVTGPTRTNVNDFRAILIDQLAPSRK